MILVPLIPCHLRWVLLSPAASYATALKWIFAEWVQYVVLGMGWDGQCVFRWIDMILWPAIFKVHAGALEHGSLEMEQIKMQCLFTKPQKIPGETSHVETALKKKMKMNVNQPTCHIQFRALNIFRRMNIYKS